MKMLLKLFIIVFVFILITDIAGSFYFYNMSVARTKKDFLANDTALQNTARTQEIASDSIPSDALPVNAKLYSTVQEEQVEIDWFNKQPYEEVGIKSEDGLNLVGYYLEAQTPSPKTAILAHGYASQGTYMGSYAKIYYDLGYNVLLPDDRGHGKSDGDYIGFGWADRKDYLKWIDYITDRVGKTSEIVLHGVSMGGATVLMTGGEDLPANVKAIVSDCAYTSVWDELEYQLKRMYHLPAFPVLDSTSLLSKIRVGFSFKEASALEQVKNIQIPTLFIHGSADEFVPTYMVNRLYEACNSPKELMIVPGAGHGTSFDTDASGYKAKIREFTAKYVG